MQPPEARPATRGPRAYRPWPLLLTGALLGVVIGPCSLDERGRAEERAAEWIVLEPGGGLASSLTPRRAAAVAEGPGGLDDVFLAWVRVTPEGELLSIAGRTNLSSSPGVEEGLLSTAPGRVAYAVRSGEAAPGYAAVEVLLLDRPLGETADWPLGQRMAEALSSLERWGQTSAPSALRLQLARPWEHLSLRWRGAELVLEGDLGELVLDPEGGRLRSGQELASVELPSQGRPDLFRWAVDQLRYSRLVGPDRLQRLEGLYLALSDALAGLRERSGEPQAPPPLPRRHEGPPRTSARDDWPPPPLRPRLSPQPGEGVWVERDERFVTQREGAPPLVTTYLRTERDRPYTSRVYLTAWDPAWYELDWVAGTSEPRSIDGHVGSGRVPREALERLVAGFNGGFQAVDGAFGMKTKQGNFLPPVPFGATVASLPNGRIGLGSWPAEGETGQGFVGYRQNLTALVEGGEVNPWRRRFWGGVPASLTDTTRTDRTGLCLTSQAHLVYLWGQRVTVAGLAHAMEAASCEYGMLLDINFSNTIFETYRVAKRGQLPDLDRPLEPDQEREGTVPGREDLLYRVQAMAPGMTKVGFPRYIRTELRDFFYLALRPEAVAPPWPELCPFRAVEDRTGAPPRAWRCTLELAGEQVELDLLDPRRLGFATGPAERGAWLAWPVATAEGSDAALVVTPASGGGATVSLVDGVPPPGPEGELVLSGRRLPPSLGGGDGEQGLLIAIGPAGQLLVAPTRGGGARALAERLQELGVEAALFVPAGERWLTASIDEAPMALRIFRETQPQPPWIWSGVHQRAQHRIDSLGLTRHYVQIRHYVERDQQPEP